MVAASDPAGVGTNAPASADFSSALTGSSAVAGIIDGDQRDSRPALSTPQVLRQYFPLVIDGQVRAVVGVWRDAAPIMRQLEDLRRNVVLVTLTAALCAAFVLYLRVPHRAGPISRQAGALVEAVQRDTLTGLLNHGALVDAVAMAVETSKARSTQPFGVALLDIDNFRLAQRHVRS